MSRNPWQSVATLLADRWQVPVALLALVATATAIWRLTPAAPHFEPAAVLADADVRLQAGDREGAAAALSNLLKQPDLKPAEQAQIHQRLAEVIYDAEAQQTRHNRDNVIQILEHLQQAQAHGGESTAATLLKDAQARLWLGDRQGAATGLRALREMILPPDERRRAVQALAELLADDPAARDERRGLLQELLDDPANPPEYAWWALRHEVNDALRAGDDGPSVADKLLEQYGGRFETDELRGYYEYLKALVLLSSHRTAEAEPAARWVLDWERAQGLRLAPFEHYGDLRGLARVLLGRVRLAQGAATDAEEIFSAVLAAYRQEDLRQAATLGLAEALTDLSRTSDAVAACHQLVQELEGAPEFEHTTRRAIVALLSRLAGRSQQRGDDTDTLQLLTAAADLAPAEDAETRLDLQERRGMFAHEAQRRAADARLRRALARQAGAAFERAAQLAGADARRQADLRWAAGQEYAAAHDPLALRRVLLAFLPGHEAHPQTPQALLLLADAARELGQPSEALRWYQRLMNEFPQLAYATTARLASAELQQALGPEHFAAAEAELTDLLTSGRVSPDAQVFSAALLTLSELYYEQQRYGDAIGRLMDYVALYGNADDTYPRYLLAAAYWRSGMRLLAAAGTDEQTRGRERVAEAARRFGELRTTLDPGSGPEARTYLQLAELNQADCLLELKTPAALHDALDIYRDVAARHENEPVALTAQVRIALAHLRQGEDLEADRALERAAWLLRRMDDAAFAEAGGPDRAQWQRYLELVRPADARGGLAAR